MMKVEYHKKFSKSAKKLSVDQQEKLAGLVIKLAFNPFHPSLHTKQLGGEMEGLFSFRITRDWRVIFRFISREVVQLMEVNHRKDVYR